MESVKRIKYPGGMLSIYRDPGGLFLLQSADCIRVRDEHLDEFVGAINELLEEEQ